MTFFWEVGNCSISWFAGYYLTNAPEYVVSLLSMYGNTDLCLNC